jgi:hypothetical protein
MVYDEDLTGSSDEEQILPEGEDKSTTSESTGIDVIVTQEKTASQTESTQTEGESSDAPDGGKASNGANKKAKQDQRDNKARQQPRPRRTQTRSPPRPAEELQTSTMSSGKASTCS